MRLSHAFNVRANYDYVGSYPDISYYNVDSMKDLERTKLIEWHAIMKEQVFNFEQELLDYCCNDVDILPRYEIVFRKLMLEKTKVDPLNYVKIIIDDDGCVQGKLHGGRVRDRPKPYSSDSDGWNR